MKQAIVLFSLFALICGFSAGPVRAQSEPIDLYKWCAAHPEDPGTGQLSYNLGVPAAKGDTWRCMDGKVMACYLGASGFGCLKVHRIDDQFRTLARQFCLRMPNNPYLPMSIIGGYGSEWRCSGTTPVETKSYPIDKDGYLIDAWKKMPVKLTPVLKEMQAEILKDYHGDLKTIELVAQNADYAAIAKNVYGGGKDAYPLPNGWARVNPEIQKISNPVEGDLFYDEYTGPNGQYVFAFQGTANWSKQWIDNFPGQLIPTDLSVEAEVLAQSIAAVHPNVVFVGHSLGGRLANFARLITGADAVVFDASITSLPEHIKGLESGVAPGHLTSFRSPQDPVSGMAPLRGDVTVENMPRVAGMSIKQKLELKAVALGLSALGPVGEVAAKLVNPLATGATIVGEAQTYTHDMEVLAVAMRSVKIIVELTDITSPAGGGSDLASTAGGSPVISAISTPEDLKAYCALHPNDDSMLNSSAENPVFLEKSFLIWKCRQAVPVTCNISADVWFCGKPRPLTQKWRDELYAFCRQRPNSSVIPMSVAGGLVDYLGCNGTTPVITSRRAVDATGYFANAWDSLDASKKVWQQNLVQDPIVSEPIPMDASPSYNCSKASKPDEIAICQSPKLSFYDQVMAKRFVKDRNSAQGYSRQKIISDQVAWLKQRQFCGSDTTCLTRVYRDRLLILLVNSQG